MINRLLDDFEDESLRTYWDKNLKFLSTQNVSEPVGISNTFFSPAFRLNLMTHDFYKDSKNHYLKNSIEFSEKSSQDIFDIYNNIISFQTIKLSLSALKHLGGKRDPNFLTHLMLSNSLKKSKKGNTHQLLFFLT